MHLGLVDASREVTLAKGARAGVGDLIVCRRNDHRVTVDHVTTLANGDVLRIEAIGEDGTLTVRLRGNGGPSGNYRWAERTFRYKDFRTAELGYAVTAHAAQGSTCSVSLAVVTGAEDRQWLYSAMTRGATLNRAFVFTRPRSNADLRPGTRPAPELARHTAAELERQGRSAASSPAAHSRGPDPRDAVAALADILQRDGSQQSATAERRQNLADSDHLAVLNAMWEGETSGLRAGRYRSLVAAALPAGHTISQVDTPAATWLWRTLRTAEAAGFSTVETLQRAIGASSLTGARDLAAVIDARIRRQIGPAIPASVRPWSEQVPRCSGDRLAFLTELAAAMDGRERRLGEFAAQHSPARAIRALGSVPDHPVDRLGWERRASDIGAYRELYAWDHQTEPIGPEPTGDSLKKRAAWHAAHAGMTRNDEADLSACSDDSLLRMRARRR